MPDVDRFISGLEMQSLILEALSVENTCDTPRQATFKEYGYKGCVSDLRAIVEHIAIKHGLIEQVVPIPMCAWGCPGEVPHYGENSNLKSEELDLFTEEVHLLIFQNVISPGAQGGYGDDWPYFHVTRYGLKCLENQDVLPYDADNYLGKLRALPNFDDWEEFYIAQSLQCYNRGTLEASVIMLGLAGEYLAIRLIDAMDAFLAKNDTTKHAIFIQKLTGKQKISQRYTEYETILKSVEREKDGSGQDKYPQLKALSPNLDQSAKAIYASFLRLTRNELAHPSSVRMDRIECLTLFISFIKYCDTQHKYLDFFVSNS